jgi:hypothetical protein
MNLADIFNSWITFLLLIGIFFALLISIQTRKKTR